MGELNKKIGESERLSIFLKKENIEVSDFAKKISVADRTLRNTIYEKKPLGPKVFRGFVEYGGSVDWLLTGRGSMLLPPEDIIFEDQAIYSTQENIDSNPDYYGIKLYKTPVSAGHGKTADNEEFTNLFFPLTWFQKRNLTPNHLIAFTLAGDSQEPDIPAGSVVFVDTTQKEIKNGKFYVFNVDDDFLIKSMHLTFDGYTAKSKNKAAGYEDIELSAEKINNLNIIGRARWVLPDYEI